MEAIGGLRGPWDFSLQAGSGAAALGGNAKAVAVNMSAQACGVKQLELLGDLTNSTGGHKLDTIWYLGSLGSVHSV